MNKYTFEMGGKTYCRISKAAARKMYERGGGFLACPCNLRPGWPWHPEIHIYSEMVFTHGSTFDEIINYAEAMNCINNETGLYFAYYAEEDI